MKVAISGLESRLDFNQLSATFISKVVFFFLASSPFMLQFFGFKLPAKYDCVVVGLF